MKERIYVVEVDFGGGPRPTVGVALTRERAREVLKEWRERIPHDPVRIAVYTRNGGGGDKNRPQ